MIGWGEYFYRGIRKVFLIRQHLSKDQTVQILGETYSRWKEQYMQRL